MYAYVETRKFDPRRVREHNTNTNTENKQHQSPVTLNRLPVTSYQQIPGSLAVKSVMVSMARIAAFTIGKNTFTYICEQTAARADGRAPCGLLQSQLLNTVNLQHARTHTNVHTHTLIRMHAPTKSSMHAYTFCLERYAARSDKYVPLDRISRVGQTSMHRTHS